MLYIIFKYIFKMSLFVMYIIKATEWRIPIEIVHIILLNTILVHQIPSTYKIHWNDQFLSVVQAKKKNTQ